VVRSHLSAQTGPSGLGEPATFSVVAALSWP
jgi:hypothetical protein